jgi:hypothetical protein
VFINPTLTITSSNICLTWPSVAGRQYYVEGKVGVADPSWTVLSSDQHRGRHNDEFLH